MVSIATQQAGVRSYQMLDVGSQAALLQLSDASLHAMHAVSHLLLQQHLSFRSRQVASLRSAGARSLNLTERQREIVGLVATGLSDKQIALHLGLSQHTVHNVLRRLMSRHALHRRIQLCRLLETAHSLASGAAFC